eukprot:5953710-Amphidinium_carterae.3
MLSVHPPKALSDRGDWHRSKCSLPLIVGDCGMWVGTVVMKARRRVHRHVRQILKLLNPPPIGGLNIGVPISPRLVLIFTKVQPLWGRRLAKMLRP